MAKWTLPESRKLMTGTAVDYKGLYEAAQEYAATLEARIVSDQKGEEPMTKYQDAMDDLNEAIYAAVRAADNEDGAPIHALREIAAEIDCLIDFNCTRKEFEDHKALYEGAKLAGLV